MLQFKLQVYFVISIVFIAIVSIIATEAIAEIITSSDLTEPLRSKWKEYAYKPDSPPSAFHNLKALVDKLITCGYCTSVWVAGIICVFLPSLSTVTGYNINWMISWMILTFFVHRLATFFHIVIQLIWRGRVQSIEIVHEIKEN